jgi:FkbM family methyltransferase
MIKKILTYLILSPNRATSVLSGELRGALIYTQKLGQFFGNYEGQLQKIIKQRVSSGDIVLDIGANIGFFSLFLSKTVGSKGKVYAFEPIPKTFDICKKNIEINKVRNIFTFQFALSNKCDKVTFRVKGDNYSMASMVWFKNDHDVEEIQIETKKLDQIKEISNKRISFIKIDVEGAEGKVIQGGLNVISQNRPTIYLECSKKGRAKTWSILFEKLSYKCFDSKNNRLIVNFDEYIEGDYLWLP